MPPRNPKTTEPTPVDAITHADKRANLPTADAQDFMAPELDQPIPVRYPRDPTLDPQLVWKGKDELDGEDLTAPVVFKRVRRAHADLPKAYLRALLEAAGFAQISPR